MNWCYNSLHISKWFFTVPPTSIEIVDHPAGSRVKIQENEEVELTCKVANAKPKAVIVWYRKDSQFVTGKIMWNAICSPAVSLCTYLAFNLSKDWGIEVTPHSLDLLHGTTA